MGPGGEARKDCAMAMLPNSLSYREGCETQGNAWQLLYIPMTTVYSDDQVEFKVKVGSVN